MLTMSTHLFPAHMRFRNKYADPEAFLTVAGVILAALVILIAFVVAVVVAGVVV